MSQRRRSRRSEHKWGQLRIVNSVLLIFLLMTASWATYIMLANNILAFRYVNILVMVLLAVVLLLSAWFVIKNQAKKTTLVLLLVGLLASSGVLFASQQLLNLTSNVNGHSNYTEFEMAVYVKKDSDIKDIKEIKEVVAPKGNNNEANLTALLDNIKTVSYTHLDVYKRQYVLSGDPAYVPRYNNARNQIRKYERDEIVEELVRYYLKGQGIDL